MIKSNEYNIPYLYQLSILMSTGMTISFQPGELAKVYMVWDEDNKCYKATSWTAKQLIDSNNNVLETRMLDEVKFVELKNRNKE